MGFPNDVFASTIDFCLFSSLPTFELVELIKWPQKKSKQNQ